MLCPLLRSHLEKFLQTGAALQQNPPPSPKEASDTTEVSVVSFSKDEHDNPGLDSESEYAGLHLGIPQKRGTPLYR